MSEATRRDGIVAGRLDQQTLAENFADLHPPLERHEAMVAADRCYFCYDAPCVTACPTSIDIPLFIRQIATGHEKSAARTILEQNILGGMCARVCPTETLCEEVCVRETAEGKPVLIGQLQRFATDALMSETGHPFERAAPTGRSIAVIGAGPAGLSCAHRLAVRGHDVTIYEAREKGGGLNEYGIAAYKTVDGFAQAELDWLLSVGGINIRHGQALGTDLTLDGLLDSHDAVFIGAGLGGNRSLNGAEGPERNATDFIAELRQATDLTGVPVGRRVVVIGGGMTAVDAAVQSRLLGAEEVTMVYRRDRDAMGASGFEQELAQTRGVRIICNAAPAGLRRDGDEVIATFAHTVAGKDGLTITDDTFDIRADQVLSAIGQVLDLAADQLELEGGKIRVDATGATSVPRVWAGGDCASGGDDLTVTAVAEGRDAAEAIHASLSA